MALIAANLAETPILGLNATDYANSLRVYLDSVKDRAKTVTTMSISFESLDYATTELQKAAVVFDAYTASLADRLGEGVPWWKWWKKVKLYYEIRKANAKYKLLERQFLYPRGLDKRPWFKHVVFAPGRWTGYAGATFPGLVESFEDRNMTNAQRWSDIIEARLKAARDFLM